MVGKSSSDEDDVAGLFPFGRTSRNVGDDFQLREEVHSFQNARDSGGELESPLKLRRGVKRGRDAQSADERDRQRFKTSTDHLLPNVRGTGRLVMQHILKDIVTVPVFLKVFFRSLRVGDGRSCSRLIGRRRKFICLTSSDTKEERILRYTLSFLGSISLPRRESEVRLREMSHEELKKGIASRSKLSRTSRFTDIYAEEILQKWSKARIRGWAVRYANPEAFYYRLPDPGFPERGDTWTDEEHQLFISRYNEFKSNGWRIGSNWGIFSKVFPHRVGYQCSNYYRQLVKSKQLEDPSYGWAVDKKGNKTDFRQLNPELQTGVGVPASFHTLNPIWNDENVREFELRVNAALQRLHGSMDFSIPERRARRERVQRTSTKRRVSRKPRRRDRGFEGEDIGKEAEGEVEEVPNSTSEEGETSEEAEDCGTSSSDSDAVVVRSRVVHPISGHQKKRSSVFGSGRLARGRVPRSVADEGSSEDEVVDDHADIQGTLAPLAPFEGDVGGNGVAASVPNVDAEETRGKDAYTEKEVVPLKNMEVGTETEIVEAKSMVGDAGEDYLHVKPTLPLWNQMKSGENTRRDVVIADSDREKRDSKRKRLALLIDRLTARRHHVFGDERAEPDPGEDERARRVPVIVCDVPPVPPRVIRSGRQKNDRPQVINERRPAVLLSYHVRSPSMSSTRRHERFLHGTRVREGKYAVEREPMVLRPPRGRNGLVAAASSDRNPQIAPRFRVPRRHRSRQKPALFRRLLSQSEMDDSESPPAVAGSVAGSRSSLFGPAPTVSSLLVPFTPRQVVSLAREIDGENDVDRDILDDDWSLENADPEEMEGFIFPETVEGVGRLWKDFFARWIVHLTLVEQGKRMTGSLKQQIERAGAETTPSRSVIRAGYCSAVQQHFSSRDTFLQRDELELFEDDCVRARFVLLWLQLVRRPSVGRSELHAVDDLEVASGEITKGQRSIESEWSDEDFVQMVFQRLIISCDAFSDALKDRKSPVVALWLSLMSASSIAFWETFNLAVSSLPVISTLPETMELVREFEWDLLFRLVSLGRRHDFRASNWSFVDALFKKSPLGPSYVDTIHFRIKESAQEIPSSVRESCESILRKRKSLYCETLLSRLYSLCLSWNYTTNAHIMLMLHEWFFAPAHVELDTSGPEVLPFLSFSEGSFSFYYKMLQMQILTLSRSEIAALFSQHLTRMSAPFSSEKGSRAGERGLTFVYRNCCSICAICVALNPPLARSVSLSLSRSIVSSFPSEMAKIVVSLWFWLIEQYPAVRETFGRWLWLISGKLSSNSPDNVLEIQTGSQAGRENSHAALVSDVLENIGDRIMQEQSLLCSFSLTSSAASPWTSWVFEHFSEKLAPFLDPDDFSIPVCVRVSVCSLILALARSGRGLRDSVGEASTTGVAEAGEKEEMGVIEIDEEDSDAFLANLDLELFVVSGKQRREYVLFEELFLSLWNVRIRSNSLLSVLCRLIRVIRVSEREEKEADKVVNAVIAVCSSVACMFKSFSSQTARIPAKVWVSAFGPDSEWIRKTSAASASASRTTAGDQSTLQLQSVVNRDVPALFWSASASEPQSQVSEWLPHVWSRVLAVWMRVVLDPFPHAQHLLTETLSQCPEPPRIGECVRRRISSRNWGFSSFLEQRRAFVKDVCSSSPFMASLLWSEASRSLSAFCGECFGAKNSSWNRKLLPFSDFLSRHAKTKLGNAAIADDFYQHYCSFAYDVVGFLFRRLFGFVPESSAPSVLVHDFFVTSPPDVGHAPFHHLPSLLWGLSHAPPTFLSSESRKILVCLFQSFFETISLSGSAVNQLKVRAFALGLHGPRECDSVTQERVADFRRYILSSFFSSYLISSSPHRLRWSLITLDVLDFICERDTAEELFDDVIIMLCPLLIGFLDISIHSGSHGLTFVEKLCALVIKSFQRMGGDSPDILYREMDQDGGARGRFVLEMIRGFLLQSCRVVRSVCFREGLLGHGGALQRAAKRPRVSLTLQASGYNSARLGEWKAEFLALSKGERKVSNDVNNDCPASQLFSLRRWIIVSSMSQRPASEVDGPLRDVGCASVGFNAPRAVPSSASLASLRAGAKDATVAGSSVPMVRALHVISAFCGDPPGIGPNGLLPGLVQCFGHNSVVARDVHDASLCLREIVAAGEEMGGIDRELSRRLLETASLLQKSKEPKI